MRQEKDFLHDSVRGAALPLHCLTPLDAAFPQRLRQIPDVPACIYVKGTLPPDDAPAAAIIGARESSDYGRELARTLGKMLAARGIYVISGLAYGIDSSAHRGAVDACRQVRTESRRNDSARVADTETWRQGDAAAGKKEHEQKLHAQQIYETRKKMRETEEECPESRRVNAPAPTCAVLGCGLDICYPPSHFLLYEDILKTGGCLISEYPPGAKPLKHHFVARNRIIAGLADVVIVVEARERSGTSITVGHALEQGKEVFAVPGRLTDPQSSGCNRLIRDGARILTAPEEVLEFFHYNIEKELLPAGKKDLPLDKNQKLLYSCLDFSAVHMDALTARSGLALPDAAAALMELEILGMAECTRHGWYRKKLAQN